MAAFVGDEEILRRVWHPRTGTEYLICELMLPHLEASFEDLKAAADGADLLVTHVLWFGAPLVAELLGIPHCAVGLQPAAFPSVHDPSVIATAPWLHALRHLGPTPFRVLYKLAALRTAKWAKPVAELRHKYGLAPAQHDPFLFWAKSATAAMGWFSPLLGPPQPDWPAGALATGFPFYPSAHSLTRETEDFLAAGDAPVVFTLGSAAVQMAGNFYEESAKAARLLDRRAILVAGDAAHGKLRDLASERIHVTAYEPYAALFPQAAALVHQCGIGTTGESLRAGVPVLGVPWGHDQFDNAARLRRLGCGAVLSRSRYTGSRAAAALQRLLGAKTLAARCAEVAQAIAAEDGVGAACDFLEAML
jgi:UDP:flavonoid glycosyltransferase YjiC (YdhE family)